MKIKTIYSLILAMIFIPPVLLPAQDLSAPQILHETKETYRALQSYCSTVKVVNNSVSNGQTHQSQREGNLQLLKPNFYKITWNDVPQTLEWSGVIWNSGAGAFLYNNGRFLKATSEEMNFASGAGLSLNVTATIPLLFFSSQLEMLGRLENPAITSEETFNGEECVVVQGTLSNMLTYKIWISKKSRLLLKVEARSIPSQDGPSMPEFSEKDLKDSVIAMGQEPTEENIEAARTMMKGSAAFLKAVRIETQTTEIFDNIKINEPLDQTAMDFKVPEGTPLQNPLDQMKAIMRNK